MRRADIAGVCELAGEGLAAGGGFIERMHRGIAQRPFGILGASALPAQVIHDRIADSVYTGLRRLYTGAARAGAELWPAVYHQIRAWIERPRRARALAS